MYTSGQRSFFGPWITSFQPCLSFLTLDYFSLKTLAYFIRNPGLCTRFQTLAYSFAILADFFTALHHLASFCSNHVHLPSLRKVVAKGDKKEFPWKIVEYWVRTCGLRSGWYSAVDCGVCSVEWSVECVGRGGVEFAVLSAKCRVWIVDCQVNGVWSVKRRMCEVWNVESGHQNLWSHPHKNLTGMARTSRSTRNLPEPSRKKWQG